MPNDPAFIIEDIMPKGAIHLLAGPSGAGKSRWLFDTLLAWEQGVPVLDYKANPVPWCYVASDRTIESVSRTLTSMGIDPAKLNMIPAWDENMRINQILDACKPYKFAVIESFGSFVDPPANSHCVRNFLNATHRAARQQGLTILGIMESPKMKPFEKYENPRQRISGAASWAHFAETIFIVEFAEAKDPGNPERMLYVCPRDGKGLALSGRFDSNGHLTFIRPPTHPAFKNLPHIGPKLVALS